jgi:L-threonylcarbamoyladenylate synthase
MFVSKKIPSLRLLQKSVFVYPTETCYGLGCDATQPALVKRIYQVKCRDFNKPLSIIVADLHMAKQYAEFSPIALQLAKQHWPGPLTLVLPSKVLLLDKDNFIALRVSSNPIATIISRMLNKPIVATSANVSGQKDCYSVKEVFVQFEGRQNQPDFIIDGGELERRLPSTVVKIVEGDVEVVREGEIKVFNV